MTSIIVSRETGSVTFETRKDWKAWLVTTPYAAYWLACCAIVLVATWTLITDSRPVARNSSQLLVAGLAAVIFGLKSFGLGRLLYGYLGIRNQLVIREGTLAVTSGIFSYSSEPEQTYSAADLTALRWEGAGGVLATGNVVANLGSTSVVVAARLNETDGKLLIDRLCEAYPFNVPEVPPSVGVVSW